MESLSTMLVQAEKQLTLTKSALEDSSTARNELKALVTELEKKNDVLERTLQSKEAEVRRIGSELEDASRTANVFEVDGVVCWLRTGPCTYRITCDGRRSSVSLRQLHH